MSDPMKHAWGDVADGFARLGGAMRERYHTPEIPERRPPPEPAAAVDALRDALDGLVAAGRDVGQRALDVLRDPEVNAEAKQAASSLNEALSATVDMIGREVANLFGGRRGKEPADDAPDEVEATLAAGGEHADGPGPDGAASGDGATGVEGPNPA